MRFAPFISTFVVSMISSYPFSGASAIVIRAGARIFSKAGRARPHFRTTSQSQAAPCPLHDTSRNFPYGKSEPCPLPLPNRFARPGRSVPAPTSELLRKTKLFRARCTILRAISYSNKGWLRMGVSLVDPIGNRTRNRAADTARSGQEQLVAVELLACSLLKQAH